LIKATAEAFEPDAIIVDYLPLGRGEELYDLVYGRPNCKKYYISRGVLGSRREVRTEILTSTCLEALRHQFTRILVMSDRRVIDSVDEYGFDSVLASKITYTGYAVNIPMRSEIDALRSARGLPSGSRWVVCSAGGGRNGEDLVQKCWELSRMFPEVYFDIIAGPRSRLRVKHSIQNNGRVVVVEASMRSLATMHAAADIVITRGGYNSLIEAAVGSANIIVVPIEWDFEQQDHARRLSSFRRLSIVRDISELDLELERALLLGKQVPLDSGTIDLTGPETAANIILGDLLKESVVPNRTETIDWSLTR
jgi:predicted glycosyltransferase